MTDRSDRSRIRNLERELEALRQENELLVDRAENIFLLGNISDRINKAKTTEAAIAFVMEDIIALKDMECCAYLYIEKNKVFWGDYYPRSGAQIDRDDFLPLTPELETLICRGNEFIDLTALTKLPAYLNFFTFNRQPSAVNFMALENSGKRRSALLTVDSSPGGVELKKITFLLEHISQSLITRLENFRLLKDINTLNEKLEKRVLSRTQSLGESEEKFRAAFSGTSDILVITKLATHKIVQVNEAFTKFTGFTAADVKGKTINELGIWLDQQARRIVLERIESGKSVENLKTQFKIKSGRIRTGLLSASQVKIKGKPHIITSVKDITQLEEYESALKERQELYEQLVETSSDSIFIVQDNCIKFCNEMLLKTSGYRRKELLGKPITEHIEPSEIPKVKAYYKKRFAGEMVPQKFLSKAVTKSGEVLDVEVTSLRIDYKGRPAEYVILRNITDLRLAYDALQKSEQLLNEMQRISKVGGWVYDVADGKAEWTRGIFDIYGLPIGKTPKPEEGASYFHPDDRERIFSAFKQAVQKGTPYDLEARFTNARGEQLRVRTSGRAVKKNGKIVRIIGNLMDVTTEKNILDRLVLSEEKFRLAFVTSPDSININRMSDGMYVDVNEGFTSITGYSREDVIGKTSLEINIWADVSDRERLVKALIQKGKVANLQARFRMKNGRVVDGIMSAAIIKLGGEAHIISITRDISDLVEAETKISNALRDKEILLQEIHHRVKNNMQVVCSLLNMQVHRTDDATAREVLRESRNRIRSMALVHEKLYLSEDQASLPAMQFIEAITKDMVNSYEMRARVRFEITVEKLTLKITLAVPCGLVINELLSNALKYAFPNSRKGVISIDLKRTGQELIIIVADDGVGLPPQIDIHRAETLGLSLVRSLVIDQLDGQILIDRKPGTKFTMTIPLDDPA